MSVRYIASSRLPTPWGVFDMHGFEDIESEKEHVVLTMGDVGNGEPVLARIHSECLTGDALFSMRCDCGIGLLNKIKAYRLQDEGADTVEANEQLGFGADMRDYSICRTMLKHLHITALRLMTNNPRKVAAIEDMGIKVVERISIRTGQNPHNVRYLETKAGKLGHWMDEDPGG